MKTRPIYSSPHFHAYLRQQRLQFELQSQQHPEAFAAFLKVYDALFTLLAYQAYASQSAVKESPGANVDPVAPTLLTELKRMAGDSLPAVDGPTFFAQRDGGRNCAGTGADGRPSLQPAGVLRRSWAACSRCCAWSAQIAARTGWHCAHTRSTCAPIHSGYHMCNPVV